MQEARQTDGGKTQKLIESLIQKHAIEIQEKKKRLIQSSIIKWGINYKIESLTRQKRLTVQLDDGGDNERIETYYLDNRLLISFIESKTPIFINGKLGVKFRYEMYEKQQ